MAKKEIDQTAECLSNINLMPPPSPSSMPSIIFKGLCIPASWEDAAYGIAYDSCTCPPPIVFICGAAKSGKSTFSRVLLDTLFKRYERVGYLDTDVGQPEFTPSGFVSLHIVENDTPDLTVLCLKTPEKSITRKVGGSNGSDLLFETDLMNFGVKLTKHFDTCPNSNTEDYLLYTCNLYAHFIKKFYKVEDNVESDRPYVPLIVKTSGWIKGLGFDMLVEMLRCMSPTHVVKVQHSKASKNLPDGTFWLTDGEKSSAEIIEICAAQKDSYSKKDASKMRDVRITAYFRQCFLKDLDISNYFDMVSQLASVTPYEFSLSKINVTYLHCEDSTDMTYESLIGMILGLAISSSDPSSSSVSIPWCVGLGIVRSIDYERGRIYVVTPIPLRIVDKVDVLLRGSIKVPSFLLSVTEMVESLADNGGALKEIETRHLHDHNKSII